MTTPGSEGARVAARREELNRRLQALGIISLARNDKTPRLTPDDWDKLAALAEAGHAALDCGQFKADTP
jgi:hypothetical protein